MKDADLLVALACFLLVDVVINAAWTGTVGIKAVRIRVDQYRPSLDYMECDWSAGIGAVYAHLAIKGGLLLAGVALTWAVRNTPSQFNESTLIGFALEQTHATAHKSMDAWDRGTSTNQAQSMFWTKSS